ncbi:unnamed protein product [Mytilus coruscus]|uniref:B box-type domain-containing protein n=1 Tax=Mytilus coruscus TaxID=42192 RepID=A0A6J8EII7_MYTCO|nr:unnamed protein product [Mytilus coruscus]
MSNIVAATNSRIEILAAFEERMKDLGRKRQNVALIKDMQTLLENISEIEGVIPKFPSIVYRQREKHKMNLAWLFGTYSFRQAHMAHVASKTCDIFTSSQGRYFCIDCDLYYCENCKVLHSRQNATRQHEFQVGAQLKYKVNSNCKKHDENYIFICMVCNVPVCSQCIAGTHNGHKVVNISEVISSNKDIVKNEIASKLQEDNRILNELEMSIDTFECQVKSVINEIREDEKKFKQIVEEMVNKMIDDVNEKN